MAASTPASPTPQAPPSPEAVRLWQELLRHLPSGLVHFDAEGRVLDANPAARVALGFANPYRLTLRELFRGAVLCDDDGNSAGNAAVLMAKIYQSHEILQRKDLRYTTPAGESRRLGVTLFALLDSDERQPTGMICLLTDLTERYALQEELQRRKNLSALGEMAAGIAHEFKNALATISGYSQMLQTHLEGVPRMHAAKILEQTAMLNNIATEFLTFARPLSVQPEAIQMGTLLLQCADSIRVQDFPLVVIQVEGEFPEVMGDPVLLTSAFMNLLRNACEAIAQSGRGARVAVRFAGAGNGQARILFEDDGPGVAAEVAEKIFIPFFTTKTSGTGLGLPMVHKIVTAHGGSVLLADSTPGHTVFAVLLPMDPNDGKHTAG